MSKNAIFYLFLHCYCFYLATLEATTENRGALTQKRTSEITIFFGSQKSPLKNLAKFLQRAGKFKCEERDQLSELHIYMVPVDAWQKRRGLAEKDIVENCISLGFVR